MTSYRDPLLGRLDHTDDPGHTEPERPTAQDIADLEPGPVPDDARFTRAWDESTRFAWQMSSRNDRYRYVADRRRKVDAARAELARRKTPA